jgi:hypothetical protein
LKSSGHLANDSRISGSRIEPLGVANALAWDVPMCVDGQFILAILLADKRHPVRRLSIRSAHTKTIMGRRGGNYPHFIGKLHGTLRFEARARCLRLPT